MTATATKATACSNCQATPIAAKGRCNACYTCFNRKGVERAVSTMKTAIENHAMVENQLVTDIESGKLNHLTERQLENYGPTITSEAQLAKHGVKDSIRPGLKPRWEYHQDGKLVAHRQIGSATVTHMVVR